MLLKDLQQLGFTKNTAVVYLVLFELGEAKAGQIVQKTGMHRNLIYRALEELEQKKMITRTEKRGVAMFKMLDPSHILNELKEKENLASHIIETLRTSYQPATQEIVIREGIEELRKFYPTMYQELENGGTLRVIGITEEWHKVLGEKLTRGLADIQRQKNIVIEIIGAKMNLSEITYQNILGNLIQYRFISEISINKSEVLILKKKVVFCLLTDPYTVIEIKNEELVNVYQQFFSSLWGQEVRTYRGWNELRQLFFDDVLLTMKQGMKEYVMASGYDIPDGETNQKEFTKFFLDYNRAGVEQGFEKHITLCESNRKQFTEEMKHIGDTGTFAHMRFLPNEHSSPLETHIFPDRVVLIAWKGIPTATVYTRPDVIEGFKKQFDVLWGIGVE